MKIKIPKTNKAEIDKANNKKERLNELKKRSSENQKKFKKIKAEEQKERIEKAKQLKEDKKRKQAKTYLPKTAQDTIPYIADYDDGIFEILPTVFSRSYIINDINYHILPKRDQESIFIRYAEMLNTFSSESVISVSIICKEIDQKQMKKLLLMEKKEDEYQYLRDEVNTAIEKKYQSGENSMHKTVCFTITCKADTSTDAIKELSGIENEVSTRFKQMDSRIDIINTGERLTLLRDIMNPNEIGEEDINYKQIVSDGLSSKDYISPDYFDFKPCIDGRTRFDCFSMGDKLSRCMAITNLPSYLSDKIISDLTNTDYPICITTTIQPDDPDKALRLINRQMTSIDKDIMEKQKKNIQAGYDPNMLPNEMVRAKNETVELLEDVQSKNQKLFFLTITIMFIADTYSQLEERTESVSRIARRYLCKARKLSLQQEKAFRQVLPLGHDILPVKRTLTTESASVFIPFSTTEIMHKYGHYYGLNAISNKIISLNRKKLGNQNGFILGSPGSGKSFKAKEDMTFNFLGTDDDILVVDPEDEYTRFVELFNAQVIKIGLNSDTYINPMDLSKDYSADENGRVIDPISLKADFLISMLETASETRLELIEKSTLDQALHTIYEDFISSDYNPLLTPTLKDLQDELFVMNDPVSINLAKTFNIYINGSLSIFSHSTNVNTTNRFVVFNIKDIGKNMKGMGLLIILDHIWNRITKNRTIGKNTWIYIDEIYILFKNENSANYLEELYKRARKWGGLPTGITQNITDLLKSDTARNMLSNSDFLTILKQEAKDLDILAELLKISDTQMKYISNSAEGEGLLKAGKDIIPFVDKFPKETILYSKMTTKPDEIKKYKELEKLEKQKNDRGNLL